MKNSNQPIISVVIPMYNCEQFVESLLGGLADQSFTDFEVICVNDGSTDKTLSLVKAFCETDSRFQYIDKENGGAGSARNSGMDIARGKYIAFLDADDLYSPDWLKEMYDAAEKAQADITICQFKFIDLLRGVTTEDAGLNAPELKTGKVVSPDDIESLFTATNPAPQNKMFSLNFLKQNDLRFPDVILAEDLIFTCTALTLAKKIIGVPKALTTIHSGLNDSSISSNRHETRMDALLALDELYAWMKKNGIEDKYEETFLRASKNAILWETNFQCKEDYIRAAAEMIQNQEPWCHLPYKKRMSYWKFNLPAMEKKIEDLKQEISETGDSDILQAQLRSATNRYESAKLLTELLNKEAPSISVVIPMYNCEQYVESMLGAIAAQTFADFEVICVNDGSTDKTLSLIKEFCAKDKRFTYLTRENGGAGAARNTGIDAASGKYMMFLDADDEYFPNFFQEMYEAAEKHNADEVFCLYDDYNYSNSIEMKSIGFDRNKLPEDAAVATESIRDLYTVVSWAVWNALLKKELIDRYALRFSTTKVANDVFFIYAYASITNTLVGVHKHLLRRRRNHNVNSITSNRWKNTEDVISALKELYSWIKSNNLSTSYLEMCRLFFINAMMYNCSFPCNEKYIEALSQCICEGDMWKGLNADTFYKKYWARVDTENMKQVLARLRDETANTIVAAQQWSNRIHTIECIEEIAYRKYGRILNPNHYYTEIASIKSELAQLKKQNKEQGDKIKSISNALAKEKKNVDKVKNSRTYKAGQYVTWLPKKVYHGLGLSKSRRIEEKLTPPIKVSIIIPVYNVEPYISRCLDSLINQTLKEIEFIFIDDCGPDNSMKIVQEYQRRDPRIRILKNTSNLGVGPSRNKGIEAAKGEYLAFIDPDDWVSPNAYEVLYKKALADHVDVVKGNIQVFDSKGKDITQEKPHFNNSVIKQRLSKGMPLYVALKSAHVSMIYSKQLVDNQSIRYGSTRSAQDGVFLLQVFLATSNISFCEDVVYHYGRQDDGLSAVSNLDRHLAFLESLKERIVILNEKGSFDTYYYQYITDYTTFILGDFKIYIEGKENEKQSEIEKYLNELEEAINLSKDPQQVFNALPAYLELKNLKYDGVKFRKESSHGSAVELSSKNNYLNLAQKIAGPVLKYYDETRSVATFPNSFATGRLSQEEIDFESFARPLWAVTYLVKDGDKELGKHILKMIANGADPQSPSYWGDFIDRDHKLVDLPAICLFLYGNIDLAREYYSEEEMNRVEGWILSANKAKVGENNWLFFAILNNAILLNVGLGGNRAVIENNWKLIDTHYLGGGWYCDGKKERRDYYIAFGYHFYSLLWLSIDKDIPADIKSVIIERAETFARSFLLFFDDNGEAVPFGRSLIYRFAQSAFWSAYVRAGLTGIPLSTVKGIMNRNIKWWLSQDIFDENGLLTLGYAYANTMISEKYSGSGSPYWACKSFVLLGLPQDAEFWAVSEEETLETEDESLCIKDAGLLVTKHQGIVNLFPLNQYILVDWTNKLAKYEKLIYATWTGFCFSNEKGSGIPEIGIDGTFAISENGDDWTVRNGAKSKFLSDTMIHSTWAVDGETSIDTYVAISRGWHTRVHIINAHKELWLADGGFAAPGNSSKATMEDKKIVLCGEDFYSEALCMAHGTTMLCQPERGLNSLDPDCTVPYILSQIVPGKNIVINSFYLGSEAPETEPVITKAENRVIVNDTSGSCQEIPLTKPDNIKVSVIIPVYNDEKHIRRCLDSLVNQSLKELELIFVDDCSQDNSIRIVEEYQKQDSRIITLHNPSNSGAGASRNYGIEIAQGEYLAFVDSDDYLAPDFYELLYSAATKNGTHDIAKGVRQKIDDEGNVLGPVDHELNNAILSFIAKKQSLYRVFSYEHTTAIYRRTLFEDSCVRYGTTYSAQDTTFLLRCCYQTKDIVFDESAAYFYVQREGSQTHGSIMKRAHGEVDALAEKAEFLKEKGIDKEAVDYLLGKADWRFNRIVELHNEDLITDEDYASIAQKYVDIINGIPSAVNACEKYPLLKNLPLLKA